MEKTGKVKQINQEIKKLERLKNEIQGNCRHKETYIKFSENGGTPKTVCCNCEKEIGYPSQNRLEKFLSN
jgi:uncharacterized protein YhaN